MAQVSERIIFQADEEVLKSWSQSTVVIPSDDEIKRQAAILRQPWGLTKKNIMLNAARRSPEYLTGLNQGKLDREHGQPFHKDEKGPYYMKGYHAGYTQK